MNFIKIFIFVSSMAVGQFVILGITYVSDKSNVLIISGNVELENIAWLAKFSNSISRILDFMFYIDKSLLRHQSWFTRIESEITLEFGIIVCYQKINDMLK